MNSERNELLAIGQDLEPLANAVRRQEANGDLLEWLIRGQRNGAPGFSAVAHQDDAVLFEALAREMLDRLGRGRIRDVDIDRRCPAAKDAGIAGEMPGLFPEPDLLRRGTDLRFPFLPERA